MALLTAMAFSCAPPPSGAGGPAAAPDQRPAPKAITTQELTYQSGPETLQGYLAYPARLSKSDEKVPGILVVHEWWGHNEYVRQRARMLAELGYAALAIDMYGKGKLAAHPAQARAFAQASLQSFPAATRRFKAGMELLQSQPFVAGEQIAGVGYCFGGGVLLNMARAGQPLTGVVSFHGGLASMVSPRKPLQTKILVLHAAGDAFVPAAQVSAFHTEMKSLQADYRFVEYRGVKHAFTSPFADEQARKFGLPVGYDAEADRQSWQEMQQFLKRLFQD